MGLRDALASLMRPIYPGTRIEYLGPTFRELVNGLTAEELYRTQPHLRTVLSFVARNVAHLGLPVFSRVSDADRRRLRDDPIARLIARPNPDMTTYELMETLVSDLGLYDEAFWMVYKDPNQPSGWVIRPIPPSWIVEQDGGNAFTVGAYTVQTPSGGRHRVKTDDMIVFHGWNPGKPKRGTSPVETLKEILAEQVEAWSYRRQVWRRGGRASSVIERPAGKDWSPTARDRFSTDFRQQWSGRGAKAGGVPILEDGMTLKQLGFSAREDEWAEVSKVALSTVASVYHVNPVMIGILDNANFSNTREFRKMLYTETLGPILAMIEARLNAFLVPRVAEDPSAYLEFNIEEKLQGDFEAQAQALQAAVGRPWMTADEARALRNMPALGGDAAQVVTPMNVLVGGQASALDSGSQNRSKSRGMRSKASQGEIDAASQVLVRFFRRQRDAVMPEIDSDDWWDEKRWNRELAQDFLGLGETLTVASAAEALRQAGLDPDAYDFERTLPFLRDAVAPRAKWVNETTRSQIADIKAGRGPDGVEDPSHAFDVAESQRAGAFGAALATMYVAFATTEAAKQQSTSSTKTWVVTSGDPRAAHAAMNGETVGVEEKFSNGADWPGDPALGADGVSGCQCEVEVTFG